MFNLINNKDKIALFAYQICKLEKKYTKFW